MPWGGEHSGPRAQALSSPRRCGQRILPGHQGSQTNILQKDDSNLFLGPTIVSLHTSKKGSKYPRPPDKVCAIPAGSRGQQHVSGMLLTSLSASPVLPTRNICCDTLADSFPPKDGTPRTRRVHMRPSDRENDHSASYMLCPMGLSRGKARSGQGTEAKEAGLEQVTGGVKGCSIWRHPLYLMEKDTKQGSRQCGKCEPI